MKRYLFHRSNHKTKNDSYLFSGLNILRLYMIGTSTAKFICVTSTMKAVIFSQYLQTATRKVIYSMYRRAI